MVSKYEVRWDVVHWLRVGSDDVSVLLLVKTDLRISLKGLFLARRSDPNWHGHSRLCCFSICDEIVFPLCRSLVVDSGFQTVFVCICESYQIIWLGGVSQPHSRGVVSFFTLLRVASCDWECCGFVRELCSPLSILYSKAFRNNGSVWLVRSWSLVHLIV